MSSATAQANEAIKHYAVSVDDYVHDSPWIALGVAVGAVALRAALPLPEGVSV